MSEMTVEKAIMLGISEELIISLTEKQLANEVRYATLSREGRNGLERRQVVVCGITHTTLPDPMVVRRIVS